MNKAETKFVYYETQIQKGETYVEKVKFLTFEDALNYLNSTPVWCSDEKGIGDIYKVSMNILEEKDLYPYPGHLSEVYKLIYENTGFKIERYDE